MSRKKTRRKETLEIYNFTVDDWFWEYQFGINRHPWKFSPGHHFCNLARQCRCVKCVRLDPVCTVVDLLP